MAHTVNSKREAWELANKLFPTDYDKDEQSSERAGYPIYRSTADGNSSWISDINTSLELNIWEGEELKTTRINIEPGKAILTQTLYKSLEGEITDKLDKAKARMECFLEELDETEPDQSCFRIVKEIKSARADINHYTALLEQFRKECTY